MVNMKRKAKKTKGPTAEMTYGDEDRDKYPYGLRINLETEELKKLGIDVKEFEVGEKVKFTCKAEITNLAEHKEYPDKVRQDMNIQITDLEFNLLAGLSLKQLKALNE